MWVVRALAAVLGAAVALGAVEIALRLMAWPMPRLIPREVRGTYRVTPHGRFEYVGYFPGNFQDFSNQVELNGRGWHDRDYAVTRPTSDTYRILVLGDSYVAAYEVPIAETFHKRLERRLNDTDPFARGRYEVIAIGQSRSAQRDELQWLERYGPEYAPDLVFLLFFGGNDIMENSPELFARALDFATRYTERVVPLKARFFERTLVVPWSRLNGLLAEVLTTAYVRNLHRFQAGIEATDLESPELGVYAVPLDPLWQQAWERTVTLLDRIAARCDELRIPLLVGAFSGPQVIGDVGLKRLWTADRADVDLARPERWIAEWSEARGVPLLRLGPHLERAGRSRVFWRHDAHLTPEGHRVIAEALYDYLVPE